MSVIGRNSLTQRFAALVDGYFRCNRLAASDALGVPLPALIAMLRGQVPVSPHVLRRLCVVSRCPREWLTEGDMHKMPVALAVRVCLIMDKRL
jgi:hypothetical protein